MKKFLLFMLIFVLALSPCSTLAATDYITVVIDGVELDPKDVNGNTVRPMLQNGTTYLPVRAIANALNLSIEWDDTTKSVFINGTPDNAEKTDVVNIYINTVKFVPTDVNGNVVNPILLDGTTYLPIRAISEEFNKQVSWNQETHTVFLTTPELAELEEGKTYAFVNKASGKAISVTDAGLVMEDFNSYNYQGFNLTKADTEGYYYITSVANGKNFDVNGNSKAAGGTIITYNQGTADNQKFAIEAAGDGYLIYALSSKLPVEDSADKVKQNNRRDSLVQKWDVVEFTPVEKVDETVYRTLSIDQKVLFNISDGLIFGKIYDNEDALLWNLIPNDEGQYIITNKLTNKSLDVANNSKTAGDPIITYDTSGDPNQCWVFEKQSDGTYLIKSVHSGLYLSIASDGSVVHAELNKSYKQNWTVSVK